MMHFPDQWKPTPQPTMTSYSSQWSSTPQPIATAPLSLNIGFLPLAIRIALEQSQQPFSSVHPVLERANAKAV